MKGAVKGRGGKPLLIMGDIVLIPYLHGNGHLQVNIGKPDYINQVFSYQRKHSDGTPDGEMIHVHIAKVYQRIIADPDSYGTLIVNVNRAQARFVLENNGIEQDHLDRLSSDFLGQPGLLLMWPDDSQSIIDGNHRYVKRAMLGLTEMKFWTVTPEQIKPALLDFPDELAPVNK